MLESSTLLLRPRDPSGVRAVVDGLSYRPLGYARPARRLAWWPGRWVIEVRELEDDPLLFTLRRGWGLPPPLEVRDAEGVPVGVVGGRSLRDGWGRCVAVAHEVAGGREFRSADGLGLARATRRRDGVELAFAESVASEPFAKMMLLAAVLAM